MWSKLVKMETKLHTDETISSCFCAVLVTFGQPTILTLFDQYFGCVFMWTTYECIRRCSNRILTVFDQFDSQISVNLTQI